MRNRGIVIFLLFTFLIVIVVFQFLSTVQSERLCERLSRAGDVLEDALLVVVDQRGFTVYGFGQNIEFGAEVLGDALMA